VILYIETNFIVGAALGRDPRFEDLLATNRDQVRICLPDVCIMEAFSTLAALRKTRNTFGGEMQRQANELRRHTHSESSQVLLGHLERAIIASGDMEEEVNGRLWRILLQSSEVSAGRIRLLSVDWRVMHLLTTSRSMDDPTDNLILGVICAHAARIQAANGGVRQALLTGNTKDFDDSIIREKLAKAGVKEFYASTEAFLRWSSAAAPSDF
jgi:hypothetical protein